MVKIFTSDIIGESIQKPALLTTWSLIHFWTGIQTAILFKYYNLPDKTNLIISFIIHSIYEFNDYYQSHINKKYIKDDLSSNSIQNSIGDAIVNLFGIIIFLKFSKQKPTKQLLTSSIIITILLFIFLIHFYGGGWTWAYHQTLRKLGLL